MKKCLYGPRNIEKPIPGYDEKRRRKNVARDIPIKWHRWITAVYRHWVGVERNISGKNPNFASLEGCLICRLTVLS
jgi:hypothetical protein